MDLTLRQPTTAVATRPYVPNWTIPNGPPPTAAPAPETLRNPQVWSREGLQAQEQLRANSGPRPQPKAPVGEPFEPITPGSLRRVLNGPAGKVAGGLAAAGAIANQMEDDSTARYAKRFGVAEPTGDGSFGDIAKFAALRAGGFASDLGNNLTMGLAGNAFRDNDMPRPVSPNASPEMALSAAGGTDPLRIPSAPMPDMTLRTAGAAPAAPGRPVETDLQRGGNVGPSNIVTRNGNSFSGTNVTQGFSYQDPNGALTTPTPRVTSMPAANFVGLNPQLDRQLAEAQARAATDPGGLTTGTGMTGIGGTTINAGLRDGGGMGGMTRRERIAAGQNAAHLASAQIGADASLRGHQIQADASMFGHQLSARTAANAARLQQMNADRQYNLEVQKFGEEKARTLFNQREAGQKSFNDWAETVHTTRDDKGNTVVDKNKVADFTNAATQTLGNMITRLKQTGDPAAIKKAEQLESQGLGALDHEDRSLLKTLYDRRERFAQTRGVGPLSGSGPVSNDLFDYHITGQEGGLLQKRLRLAGGQTIPEKDLAYTEPANAILPDWFKTPTTALGPTLQERKGLR